MLYRNRRTGRTVDVSSVLCGDWEPVAAPGPAVPAKTETAKKPVPAKTQPAKKATTSRAASAKKAPPRKTTRK